jgi:TctA family transporter
MKQSLGAIVRGTLIGSFLGLLPGAGPVLSSFASYAVEKKMARHPEEFGQGVIQGVAGPEAANNGAAQSTFIPMLTLGIPSTGAMALMLGALMIHDIAPGPEVISKHPNLFWGLIVSMWIGNGMLLLLNLPLVGFWVKLLQVPYRYLFPTILAMMAIGVYSVSNQGGEIYPMVLFGLLGYVFKKLKCEPAPLILAFVLGPMVEENFRRAMLLSRGDPAIFLTRPISAVFLVAAVLILVFMIMPAVRKKREEVVAE